VSGLITEKDIFNFLRMEKNTSKAGYHKRLHIKYGEINKLDLYISIKKIPDTNDKTYTPLSPKKSF
jgi:hypothetical protein|tara:strand:+ start:609 stop:806 length:198 start_codon:yes stop_codon:yes gene_type:complete